MIPIGIEIIVMKKFVFKSIGNFINLTAILFPKWSSNYAFDLLCKVKRVGISKKGQEFFDKGTTTHLNAGGHSAVLHTWGTGDRHIIFLHGWMSNAQRWLPYAHKLDYSEFTLHALDMPGHGMATGDSLNLEMCRDALAQTFQKLGKVDTVVGHSLGSLVAAYTYLHNPSVSVEKFVIMGSPSGMDAIFVYFKQMLGLSNKAINNLEKTVNSILKIPHTEVTMTHFFEKTVQPVFVVHESTDKVTPFQPIEQASKNQKNIKQYITNDQDHNLKGKEVVNKVIQFIKH